MKVEGTNLTSTYRPGSVENNFNQVQKLLKKNFGEEVKLNFNPYLCLDEQKVKLVLIDRVPQSIETPMGRYDVSGILDLSGHSKQNFIADLFRNFLLDIKEDSMMDSLESFGTTTHSSITLGNFE